MFISLLLRSNLDRQEIEFTCQEKGEKEVNKQGGSEKVYYCIICIKKCQRKNKLMFLNTNEEAPWQFTYSLNSHVEIQWVTV